MKTWPRLMTRCAAFNHAQKNIFNSTDNYTHICIMYCNAITPSSLPPRDRYKYYLAPILQETQGSVYNGLTPHFRSAPLPPFFLSSPSPPPPSFDLYVRSPARRHVCNTSVCVNNLYVYICVTYVNALTAPAIRTYCTLYSVQCTVHVQTLHK